jgi:hypothetical protein
MGKAKASYISSLFSLVLEAQNIKNQQVGQIQCSRDGPSFFNPAKTGVLVRLVLTMKDSKSTAAKPR